MASIHSLCKNQMHINQGYHTDFKFGKNKIEENNTLETCTCLVKRSSGLGNSSNAQGRRELYWLKLNLAASTIVDQHHSKQE